MADCAEKDKTQANDSKLIMQLSKKLETLLMENEDLRDNNDRLNTRLVQVECKLKEEHWCWFAVRFADNSALQTDWFCLI